MYSDGNDCDEKPKKIGRFKTEQEARQLCLEHYQKACKMALAANRQEPKILFI